eukprot:scaffold1166_cov261-Pinguiococcus_pyrenoidosus.AAC.19
MSTPVSVTRSVCSNCALREPSLVTAVQLSGHVNHGLDGEDVADLHGALGLVLCVVRNVRTGVEERPDAMATVRAHDAAAGLFGASRDARTQIGVVHSRPAHLHRSLQALKSAPHELPPLFVDIPDQEGLVQVGMEAIHKGRHINIDNVPVPERALIRDPMANHLREQNDDSSD